MVVTKRPKVDGCEKWGKKSSEVKRRDEKKSVVK